MNKSNVIAATATLTAKNKQPSKVERLRSNVAKANARAAKALTDTANLSFDSLAATLVASTGRADSAARVMAHYMNDTFAEPMRAFKCHWSAFTSANCRTDNEKGILSRIEGYRKQVQDLALAKGLANTNKPWSDMRKVAIDLHNGGNPREKTPLPLDTRFEKGLLTLYKAGMKEERQTDTEQAVNIAIGELLVQYFKTDITKY
jgi:hypothetical protein